MNHPSIHDATQTGTKPTDVTTPSTDPQSSVSSNNPKKPLPKRLAMLPDARERFSVNGEKMMFNYKRTRRPNKNKATLKKPDNKQATSRTTAAGGSLDKEGAGDAVSDETDGAIALHPAPSATPGAHDYSWDDGSYFPAFGTPYTQDPSSFQTTQPPMNPNHYLSDMRQQMSGQTPASGHGTMQPAPQPQPSPHHLVSTPGGGTPHLGGHSQYVGQGSSVDFIQYSSSSFQGTSDVSRQYPDSWGEYQQQLEWGMQEDNGNETGALPHESAESRSGNTQAHHH